MKFIMTLQILTTNSVMPFSIHPSNNISFIFNIYTLFEPQNIIWTPINIKIFGHGFPLYNSFHKRLKTKSISFIFTFLEPQNIIWTPFQTQIGQGFPLYLTFSDIAEKKHFILFEHFTFLESQNIIRTPFEIPFQKKHHLDPLSKENLDIGFPIYFIIQNG